MTSMRSPRRCHRRRRHPQGRTRRRRCSTGSAAGSASCSSPPPTTAYAELLDVGPRTSGRTAGWRSASRAPAPTGSGSPASSAGTATRCIEVNRPPRKGERRLSRQERHDRRRARRPASTRRRSTGHAEDRRRQHRGAAATQDRPRHSGEGPHRGHDHAEGDAGDRRRRTPRRARAAHRPQARSSACAALDPAGDAADPDAAMRHVLRLTRPTLARPARRDQGPQPAPQDS